MSHIYATLFSTFITITILYYNYYFNFRLFTNRLESLSHTIDIFNWLYIRSVSKPNQAADCCRRHIARCLKDLQCDIIKIAMPEVLTALAMRFVVAIPLQLTTNSHVSHQIDIRESSCCCNTVKRSRRSRDKFHTNFACTFLVCCVFLV